MGALDGRRILLGVSGSIAAFKAAALASALTAAGADVQVVLTAAAQRFVSAETFGGLTRRPVAVSLWKSDRRDGADHVDLARWAEIVVVAPASAHTIARASLGLADDLLTTILLATEAPILMAPAMESRMYAHEATHAHIRTLESRGVVMVGPVHGRLASGIEGPGRMVEPEDVQEAVSRVLTGADRGAGELAGVQIVVTAGPTREPLDPVRYLSNRSSGKMGYEIARAAHERGAAVTLISGPVDRALIDSLPPVLRRQEVETAAEMMEAVVRAAAGARVVIMCAAVADYRPADRSGEKIKKSGDVRPLALEPTEDILSALQALAPQAVRIGFAAETERVVENAQEKLRRKSLHMIVANDVSGRDGPVFGEETNRVILLQPDKEPKGLPRLSKRVAAEAILDCLPELLAKQAE